MDTEIENKEVIDETVARIYLGGFVDDPGSDKVSHGSLL